MSVRDVVMDMRSTKLYRVMGTVVDYGHVSCMTFAKSKAEAEQKVTDWYREYSKLQFKAREAKVIHSGVLEITD